MPITKEILDARISSEAIKWQNELPPPQPPYHCLVSCLISQKISFARSRAIRRRLYHKLEGNICTAENMASLSTEESREIGLTETQIAVIRDLPNPLETKHLTKIPMIGKWTRKAIAIMTYSDDNIFLAEDAYIRKRLCEIYGLENLNAADATQVAENWLTDRSLISRFLWRLKPSGAAKIARKCDISAEDLI
jgi:3-methyladenine DNA glycosylase/8-oxoguanine DNA glycosylase